jgi:3-oxoacyl-[acyl-carrier protein] reductase
MARLQGKVVLVTGASRGLGKAIALRFAAEGAKIVITFAKSEDKAEEVVAQIKKLGGEIIALRADIAFEADVQKLVEATVGELGNIDILVNNAGYIVRPGHSNVVKDSWDRTIAVNLTGAWMVTKYVVPHMKAGGAILNIASYVGQLGSQWVLAYGAAKAGMINMTKAYAKELAPYIRVNCISPGNFDTDMSTDAGQEFIAKTVANTPLKRLGTPEELANAALFLCSDEASFVTGVNLDVDGGFMLTN